MDPEIALRSCWPESFFTRKPENQKTRKPENQKTRKPENWFSFCDQGLGRVSAAHLAA